MPAARLLSSYKGLKLWLPLTPDTLRNIGGSTYYVDRSGNGNHGLLHYTTTPPVAVADHHGNLRALSLVHTDPHWIEVTTNSGLIFGTGDFTVSMFVQSPWNYLTQQAGFVGKGSAQWVTPNAWGMQAYRTNRWTFVCGPVGITSGTVSGWKFASFVRASGVLYEYFVDAGLPVTAEITHIDATADLNVTNNVKIGVHEGGANYYLSCNLKHMRVYNRALSIPELSLLSQRYYR